MGRNGELAQMETSEAIIDEWTMKTALGDETVAAVDSLGELEAPLDDAEPWQRLGDVLGRITGVVDME